jgi:hypothetical protein
MKSLHRLTPAKYQWSEPQRNCTSPSKEHTIYFLGIEGIVIQQESKNGGLWMHVTSDGLGILWGKLHPDSNRSIHHGIQTDRPTQPQAGLSSLYTEAFSRSPISFSKHSLSSLITLQCQDIISLYESLEHAVHWVKLQTPKITVLLYTTNESHSSDYVAKTMLMENDPIGDIQTEFDDGTIIRLSSVDGIITVKGEDRSTRLVIDPNRFFAELKAERPSPSCRREEVHRTLNPSQLFIHHLCIFLESARECLLYESLHSSNTYPAVRKFDMHGWHQGEWVARDPATATQ